MKKIKLIALDIDGTMLTDDGEVTKDVQEAIRKATRQGIQVILCTGRMYRSAKNFGCLFKDRMPIITYNGALIKELNDGNILYHQGLPSEDKLLMFNKLTKYNLQPNIYTGEALYSIEGNPYIADYAEHTKVPYTLLKPQDIESFLEPREVTKMVGIGSPEQVNTLLTEEAALHGDNIYFAKSFDFFLEIGHKDVNKGKALEKLGEMLDIETAEMMAVGDNLNDAEMLETVGHPVLMGNGVEMLQKKGYFVTKSNNESGVAYAISQFLS